jgi:hypothetical protein
VLKARRHAVLTRDDPRQVRQGLTEAFDALAAPSKAAA